MTGDKDMLATLSAVQPIIDRCTELFEDLDFKAVKEWKAAVPGRKAIGYMPVYVPRAQFLTEARPR